MLFGSSVELFVYLPRGSGIPNVQINNTPHRIVYIENDICLYTVMSVCIAYPCLLKNRQIFSVRISETLSLN